MNINFKNIISHKGDQKSAFEELVCQLAFLDKPYNSSEFIRKGRGADGGAECYWVMDSGEEICWQAKYFTDRLSDNELNQIDDSVKSAIIHHPKMKEYIICVPIDRTDSRQLNRDSTKKQTEMVRWENKVHAWTSLAQENGINVKFTYWGETELLSRLLRNDTYHEGIKDYFFGYHTIKIENLVEILQRSKASLGDRYSQEDNIELEIFNVFEALSNTDLWKQKLKKALDLKSIVNFLDQEIDEFDTLNLYNKDIEILKSLIKKFYKESTNADLIIKIRMLCLSIEDELESFQLAIIYTEIHKLSDQEQYNRRHNIKNSETEQISEKLRLLISIREKLNVLIRATDKIADFLSCNEFRAYANRILLIDGEAGIGKSHLLCDATVKLLEKKMPTLLLLGQHYPGGNPLLFIKEKLGINGYNDTQTLSLLNVMAESYESRFTLIIDAINEGTHRKEWNDYLVDFIDQIKEYPNISLAVSCRTTYKNYIIPKNVLGDNDIVKVTHLGFSNLEEKAVEKYFLRRDILIPSSPILKPEFSNPLFLKTCCDALISKGLKEFPKGIDGFVSLFEFYLNVINEKISKDLNCRSSQGIVFKYVNEFINILFPDKFYEGISTDDAEEISSKIYSKGGLLDLLIHEGLLSLDIYTNEPGRQEEIVRFTFERYGEHIVARQIISNCITKDEIANLFINGNIIHNLLSREKRYEFRGVINALAIYIAEKFNCEFIEFLDEKTFNEDRYYFIEETFTENILWRSSKGICQKSYDLLNEIGNDAYGILINLSTEPEHPWNILYLESFLIKMTMADRDKFWSIFVAEDPEWNSESSFIHKILSWAQKIDYNFIEKERLELLSYLMVWFTSTSNRYIRDVSTKILSKILYTYPDLITIILTKYNQINDMYILERLYAAVFGAVVYIRDSKFLTSISETVYNLQFKDTHPTVNIMVREYATSIMEYVFSQGVISLKINFQVCKPPFTSEWSFDLPTTDELDLIEDVYGLSHSLYGFGDFRKYEMSCVKSWSITPIDEDSFTTGLSLQKQLLSVLDGECHELFKQYMSLVKKLDDFHEENDVLDLLLNSYQTYDKKYDEYSINEQKIKDEIKSVTNSLSLLLSNEEQLIFQTINHTKNDSTLKFDIDLASRFIHKRILDFGWTNNLFKDFDSRYSFDAMGRQRKRIERIGKKYQWIAFYELLARLSDNFKWIGTGYADLEDDYYYSTIQISQRNIDPTMWIKKTENEHDYYREQSSAWWEMSSFSFSKSLNINPNEWLERTSILPDFAKLLILLHNDKCWTVLHGFSDYNQNEKNPDEFPNAKREKIWYSINSAIIPQKDRDKFIKTLLNKHLESPDTFSTPTFTSELFYGEFHWHSYFQKLDSTKNENAWSQEDYDFPLHIPNVEYFWERSANDSSFEESVSVYLPSSILINELNLHNTPLKYGAWQNAKGETVFFDPSVYEKGNGYALINTTLFEEWIEKNGYEIVWFIGGEKQLHHSKNQSHNHGVDGRYTFNFVFAKDDSEIKQLYFKDEIIYWGE